MSKKPSQKDRVIEKLRRDGEVDNFWAIENKILRLGAIMYELRDEGWEFHGMYGKERRYERALWKNYYYILGEKMKQVVEAAKRKEEERKQSYENTCPHGLPKFVACPNCKQND